MIIQETVESLGRISEERIWNPYREIGWPNGLIGNSDTPEWLSLYGTPVYEQMDELSRKKLAFYEAVTFLRLNIHGEKFLLERLSRRLYDVKNSEVCRYLHHFPNEENRHMVLFSAFCMHYAAKIYLDKKLTFPREYVPGEEEFLFFTKVMIFEEIVDAHNVKMLQDERLLKIIRQINSYHHLDEVRHLWIHARSEAEFERKRQKAEALFVENKTRVRYSWGDLTEALPFLQVGPGDISHIVHSAAVTRFNVDEDTARRVNVEGTEKLLTFADTCPNLERVGFVGTVYVSGLRAGEMPEWVLDDFAGFGNFYECSKWAAEQVLVTRYAHLPWQIFRTAIVIADDDTGRVIQQNAVHNTLKFPYYGLLSLVPGHAETPVYLVTGEFVVGAIFALLQESSLRQIYHVCPARKESKDIHNDRFQKAWPEYTVPENLALVRQVCSELVRTKWARHGD